MSILTYNLMAESLGPPLSSRFPFIIEALSSTQLPPTATNPIMVLCLQEVNDEILPLLLADPFIQTSYPFSTHTQTSLLPSRRNQVTFASAPFTHFIFDFEERHKRALISSFNYFPAMIANVHLSSSLSDEAVASKASQMRMLTDFMKESRKHPHQDSFIVGDFNITSSAQTVHTALSDGQITSETAEMIPTIIDSDIWQDAFNTTHYHGNESEDKDNERFDDEEGATFSRLSNPLAALSKVQIDTCPQRYDRVLFNRSNRIQVEAYSIFGQPDKIGNCGSDHYGVSTTLKIGSQPLATSDVENSASAPAPSEICIFQHDTDISVLLEQYQPTLADKDQRVKALELLRATLTERDRPHELILAPLGSYLLETYFADSDIDILVIGAVAPQIFFDDASNKLHALEKHQNDEGFRGVHLVNSLVSIIEVEILGIKFDLQYCQAAELVTR
jgi:endonuclease/exonuclease/phosphatase family metal-dependent hydrolase